MGRRGPAAKPVAVHIAEGTYRADRHGELDEQPMPDTLIPLPPPHLNDVARAEWDRVAPLLKEMGTIALIDMATLAGYCVNFARWVEAELAVAEQGVIVRSPNGYPVQNPFLSVANRAAREMKAFGEQFGASPASRARLTIHPPTRAEAVV